MDMFLYDVQPINESFSCHQDTVAIPVDLVDPLHQLIVRRALSQASHGCAQLAGRDGAATVQVLGKKQDMKIDR